MDKWLIKQNTDTNVECIDSNDPQTSHTTKKQSNRSESPPISAPKKFKATRKYNEDYIKYGFSVLAEEGCDERPQCVICHEVLSNHSMKPSLLKRHITTKHSSLENNPKAFFEQKKREMRTSQTTLSTFCGTTKKAVEASFLVSYQIAKCGKPHTIGEELIFPATKAIVKCMLGEDQAKKLDTVSLSNNTVGRRINDMALNVKELLINQVKQSDFFSLQIDESTDIAHCAQLLVFIRYIFDSELKEDFLFCEELPTRTTSDEIFKKLNEFMMENTLDWKRCVGLCTDGARAMTGKYNGVITKVKAVSPDCKFTHCVIHREALVCKRIPDDLKEVLNDAVKVVNFIKSRSLNSRLFGLLCADMDSAHTSLLLNTEVRWLSRGKMLNRLIELRTEVEIFLNEMKFELHKRFLDDIWLQKLSYLADIFTRLNDLNLSLQGPSKTPFIVEGKINAMKKKLKLIVDTVAQNNYQSLPNLETFLIEKQIQDSCQINTSVIKHCNMLISSFDQYFNEEYGEYLWIQTPFLEQQHSTMCLKDQEALIELSCDPTQKIIFQNTDLYSFWIKQKCEYNSLYNEAMKLLLPFTSTYLCEAGFSSMVGIKTKYRNKLNLEPNMRLKLSKIEPNIDILLSQVQCQISH